jgi:multidrug resistance efflux pump
MNIQQYEEIKEKIEQAKTKKIQAKTKIDQIEELWKEKFDDYNELEDVEKKLAEITANFEKLKCKEQNLLFEIEELMNEKSN